MLPKGWKKQAVEDCADLLTGNAFRSEDYVEARESTVKLLRGDNIIQGSLRWDDAKHWATPYAGALQRYEMQAGDIVLAMDRPIVNAGLKCSVVRQQDLPSLLVQRVARLRAKKNFDQGYLAHVLQTHRFIEHLRGQKTETAVPHISPNDIREFEFPCPINPVEQRRIAQILSTWDQAIATTERLLANSEAQKLGLMQGLFTGKHRLDGHTIGWQEHLLGKLFAERVEPNRADLQLLSITREQGVILRADVGRKDTSNEDKSKYLRICHGDIGYNTMRMWQGVSALSQYEGIISPAYTVITPGALIDGQFASFLFKSQAIIFLFYRHSQGLVSDTWNLKFSHFAKIKIKIPSVEEQRRIAEVLEKADQKISVIQRQLSALREEKTALMSQLLTGKRRVNMAEVETETQT